MGAPLNAATLAVVLALVSGCGPRGDPAEALKAREGALVTLREQGPRAALPELERALVLAQSGHASIAIAANDSNAGAARAARDREAA